MKTVFGAFLLLLSLPALSHADERPCAILIPVEITNGRRAPPAPVDTADPVAMTALAYRLQSGDQIARDEVRAGRLMRAAAEQGLPSAMIGLSYFYARGLGGLPKDLGQSEHWRLLSGHPRSSLECPPG